MYGDLKVLAGNSNEPIARAICKHLDTTLAKSRVERFSDGEIRVEIDENVRGRDVFLVQSTSQPANDHLMELLIMMDACKRASAGRITAVMPYYGYARQDRKVRARTPITAKLIADLLEAAGAGRVLTMDLHAGQIQGFFDIPVDNLYCKPALLPWIQQHCPVNDLVIVSPDAGGAERARSFAKHLGCGLAIVDKRRDRPNVSEVMHVVGDVEGKYAVLVDDMIDTAGTLTSGAAALKAAGASTVIAVAGHPVFSGPAIERIENSHLEKVVVTDTIKLQAGASACEKIVVCTVADVLAEAIRSIHFQDSVSRLFV